MNSLANFLVYKSVLINLESNQSQSATECGRHSDQDNKKEADPTGMLCWEDVNNEIFIVRSKEKGGLYGMTIFHTDKPINNDEKINR